jgi:hypothetical protein
MRDSPRTSPGGSPTLEKIAATAAAAAAVVAAAPKDASSGVPHDKLMRYPFPAMRAALTEVPTPLFGGRALMMMVSHPEVSPASSVGLGFVSCRRLVSAWTGPRDLVCCASAVPSANRTIRVRTCVRAHPTSEAHYSDEVRCCTLDRRNRWPWLSDGIPPTKRHPSRGCGIRSVSPPHWCLGTRKTARSACDTFTTSTAQFTVRPEEATVCCRLLETLS